MHDLKKEPKGLHRSKGRYGSSGSDSAAFKKSGIRSSWSLIALDVGDKNICDLYIPCNASVIRTRRHCMGSTRCSFLRRLRYSKEYVLPSDRSRASTLAFGWRSTFLMKANSS